MPSESVSHTAPLLVAACQVSLYPLGYEREREREKQNCKSGMPPLLHLWCFVLCLTRLSFTPHTLGSWYILSSWGFAKVSLWSLPVCVFYSCYLPLESITLPLTSLPPPGVKFERSQQLFLLWHSVRRQLLNNCFCSHLKIRDTF